MSEKGYDWEEEQESGQTKRDRLLETAKLHLEQIQQIYREGMDLEDELLTEEREEDTSAGEDPKEQEESMSTGEDPEEREEGEPGEPEPGTEISREDPIESDPEAMARAGQNGKKPGSRKGHAGMRPEIPRWGMVIQAGVFFALLLGIGVLGLIMPLRPEKSETEKRILTAFPSFSLESFLSGEYTEQISTWYADTFPLRERLVTCYTGFSSLFGFQNEQLIGDVIIADEIPPVDDVAPNPSETSKQAQTSDETSPDSESATGGTIETGSDESDSSQEDTTVTDASTEAVTTPAPDTTTPEEKNTGDNGSKVEGEKVGSVYLCDNKAYSGYGFSLKNSNRYAELINTAQTLLQGTSQVYAIPVPLSYGILLDSSAWEKMGWSDESAAIKYMLSQMDDSVKKVSVFDNLYAHRDEYIYFGTDHHWTALGAYYAYECFAQVKGIEAHPLSSFETMTFDNFLGSLYSQSNKASALEKNPDTITAYVPMGTNKLTIWQKDGSILHWKIINDVTNYATSSKYSCFIGGDQPYEEIENPNIQDGSSVMLVKESYGNAFAPFLVDHYQYIYIVDFRYYQGTLAELAKDKKIQDVIFLNNLNSAGGSTLLAYLDSFINGSGE